LYCACHEKCICADPLQISHACHRFWNATKPSRFSHFSVDAQSTPPTTQNDVWTSKMSPRPSVFNTFDFEMCFVPLRRDLFGHLNFQKWSETVRF
jgi:hypothetical protein